MRYVLLIVLLLSLCGCASYQPTVAVQFDPLPTPIDETEVLPPPPPVDMVQAQCLALNVYHEARGEGVEGMVAVAYVTLNRAQDTTRRFRSTVCGVVRQGAYSAGRIVLHRCEFSWYCDGRSDRPTDQQAYQRALELAVAVLQGTVPNPIGQAVYYHRADLKWRYASHFTPVGSIRNHTFYRA